MVKRIINITIISFVLILAACSTNRDQVETALNSNFSKKLSMNDSLSWVVNLPETREYIVTFILNNPSDEVLFFNFSSNQGHNNRVQVKPTSRMKTVWLPAQLMMSGDIVLSIDKSSESLEILELSIGSNYSLLHKPLNVTPINPNASEEVVELMEYLASVSGKGILSGQMDLTWDDSIDMEERVVEFTGKHPAIMGFDFMNYKSAADRGNGLLQVEEAIDFYNRGGLITFCWHWRVGESYKFYTKETDFRINRDPESLEYKTIISDIDAVADQLATLQNEGIPVLWRPLHEASGGWFWWGATGSEDYKFLWNLMYRRLTEHHKLNNLIWVWNGEDDSWYPGDDKLDIIGVDIYEGKGQHHPFIQRFAKAESFIRGDEGKLIAITENGCIPDPSLLVEEGIPWAWFMTWNDNNSNAPEDFFSGNLWTSHENKQLFYNHPYVINMNDLK